MSSLVVARKDFQDAIRSKLLWVLSALFALLAVGIAVAYSSFDLLSGGNPTAGGLLYFVSSSLTLFVTIAAIVVCHRSIVGERESGSLKLLLSLPHSRIDVVLGKLIGRTGVLAVPILGTLLLGIVLGGALGGIFDPIATIGVLGITLLFILTYASIFLGISALTKSTTIATALSVVYFVVFEVVWGIVGVIILFAANGFEFSGEFTVPDWYYVFSRVPPSAAFEAALNTVVSGASAVQAGGGGGGSGFSVGQTEAFYAEPWIGFVMLAFWLVVPVAIGMIVFNRTDL